MATRKNQKNRKRFTLKGGAPSLKHLALGALAIAATSEGRQMPGAQESAMPNYSQFTQAPMPKDIRDVVSRVSTARTWYDVLGVQEKASPSEIKAAYRAASMILHPDKLSEEGKYLPKEIAERLFKRTSAAAEWSFPRYKSNSSYLSARNPKDGNIVWDLSSSRPKTKASATPQPKGRAPPTPTPQARGRATPTATVTPQARGRAPPTATPQARGRAPPTATPQARGRAPPTASATLRPTPEPEKPEPSSWSSWFWQGAKPATVNNSGNGYPYPLSSHIARNPSRKVVPESTANELLEGLGPEWAVYVQSDVIDENGIGNMFVYYNQLSGVRYSEKPPAPTPAPGERYAYPFHDFEYRFHKLNPFKALVQIPKREALQILGNLGPEWKVFYESNMKNTGRGKKLAYYNQKTGKYQFERPPM